MPYNDTALAMASTTPATMAATAVKATAMKTSGEAAMEAAGETRPAAERVSPRGAAMIETAERAGMHAKLIMCSEAMERAAMKSAAVSETAAAMEHVAVADEGSAPGGVGMVIEVESVVVPVGAPLVPSPAIAGKDAEA
jgi:hypothetical protein